VVRSMAAADGGEPAPFTSVPLTSCNGVAAYTATVTLGDSQPFELTVDTGSSTLGVASAGCSACADAGVQPTYQPGDTAADQDRTVTVDYGAIHPTGYSGEVYEDAVSVGTPAAQGRMNLVAIRAENGFFPKCGGAAQGILGLQSDAIVPYTNSFFDQLVAETSIPNVFALELCNSSGTPWLGGYDSSAASGAPVFTRMFPESDLQYAVTLTSIQVAGTSVVVPTGEYAYLLLDTGTSISSFVSTPFDALTAAIGADATFSSLVGPASFFSSPNNSVTLSQTQEELDAMLPSLTLVFGVDPSVSVQATATESYLTTYGGGAWQPSIQVRSGFAPFAAILGAPILRSNIVIFDRAKSRAGFAPHSACPRLVRTPPTVHEDIGNDRSALRLRSPPSPMSASAPAAPLRIVPLGGLGEVGMNCLALEQDGQVLLIDCGVTFDDRGLGVDVIHPSFEALEAYRGRLLGIFLTHGHEDHLGAVAHFLKRFDVPVWGPPYSLELLRERSQEHEVLRYADLRTVRPREPVVIGPFTVEPMRVTHSTADATALAIDTAAGKIIHTGDFKFDETPPDGEMFDIARFAELGDAGVRLLMSDSTNIDVAGPSGSEEGVREVLHALVAESTGRVIIGLFASNVHRLRIIADIARKTGRMLVPLGRSVGVHARVAVKTGYLAWPDDLTVGPERAATLPRERVLGIATGTQAEANAALGRLSRGEHPLVLDPGDHIIFSSRVIPGHEPEVAALESALLRRGFRVTSRALDGRVHVSGHASRVEQTRMIELVRPRGFIPLHGTRHHLVRHAALAASLGVPETLVLENGDVGLVDDGLLRQEGRWTSGRVHLGFGREVPGEILKERSTLAAEGVVFVVVPVSQAQEVGELQLHSRGVLAEPERSTVLAAAKEEGARAARETVKNGEAAMKEAVRVVVRRAVAGVVGYKLSVVVAVVSCAVRGA
jgi:ribonuclease J